MSSNASRYFQILPYRMELQWRNSTLQGLHHSHEWRSRPGNAPAACASQQAATDWTTGHQGSDCIDTRFKNKEHLRTAEMSGDAQSCNGHQSREHKLNTREYCYQVWPLILVQGRSGEVKVRSVKGLELNGCCIGLPYTKWWHNSCTTQASRYQKLNYLNSISRKDWTDLWESFHRRREAGAVVLIDVYTMSRLQTMCGRRWQAAWSATVRVPAAS